MSVAHIPLRAPPTACLMPPPSRRRAPVVDVVGLEVGAGAQRAAVAPQQRAQGREALGHCARKPEGTWSVRCGVRVVEKMLNTTP